MYTRLLEAPRASFFLLGPRGTGKTTWLRQKFAGATWFNLLDEGLYQRLLANPSLFGDALRAVPAGSWVVVDEIQRLPGLLNEVHRAIEERKLKFALTGSSARKLRQAGTNLLAGRALRRAMFPLAPPELGRDFSLEKALRIGTLPLVWDAPEPEETLEAYVQLYLKEEIQAEAVVRNLPGFARFLPIAALFHGQTLNVAALARDAEVSRTTVGGYVEILEDTLLATRVTAFEARLRVRERKAPKLYWIDPGVVRALKRSRGPVLPEEAGPLFEGLVFTLLRTWNDAHRAWDDIQYWAPAEARFTEVDFVLRSGAKSTAVEVKAATAARPEHLTGLEAIADLPGIRRRVLVYRGRERLTTKSGIEVLPFQDFAEELFAGRL
jgi:predicted AAA+ superfamily ATPase